MSWTKSGGSEGDRKGGRHYSFTEWISWIFFVASMLLLSYTYYRSEIVYMGTIEGHYFKYYMISLVSILFFGGMLRLKETIRANIVMVVISLVAGLYLVEGGLTLLGPEQSQASYNHATDLGVEYDQRTRLEVIEDLVTEGVYAVPVVHPSALVELIGMKEEGVGELFPLAGVSYKTTVYNNESGKYLIYKSDRYGFNNPDDQWDKDSVEWLLTGDSFVHGSAVQPGEEMAGQLRSITKKTAISLGMGGNGPLVEYAVLGEYGKHLAPSKVLWVYYEGNDLKGNLQRDKGNLLLMQYMGKGFSQKLIHRQQEIDSRLGEYIVSAQAKVREQVKVREQDQDQDQLYATRWMRLHAIRNLINFDGGVDVDPLFTSILTKAKVEVEAWGGRMYFVYLPEYERYSSLRTSHDRFRKKEEVINLVKRLNIPVIDIHQEVFADHPDPLALFPFRLYGHYNAEGYANVAKAIVNSVQ